MSKLPETYDTVIPVYNGAPYIGQAIESVIRQQPKARQIIVIDDCSTDETPNILKKFGNQINVIRHGINRGLPAARNTGIRAGDSGLIAFLDADDAWIEGKIEKQIKEFKDTLSIGLCYTDIIDCDSNLNPDHPPRGFRKRKGEYVFNELYYEAFPIPPSTVMVRREIFENCGMFDETMLRAEDYECWLRIAMRYPISCIAEPLCLRRNNPDSITNTSTLEKEIYYTLRLFELCGQAALKWNIKLLPDISERRRLYFFRRLRESINWRDPLSEEYFGNKLKELGGLRASEKIGLAFLKIKEELKQRVKKLTF